MTEPLFSVSAPKFIVWKILDPVLTILLFAGVGCYCWFNLSGTLWVLSTLIALLLCLCIIEALWRAAVLKEVKMDRENLYVSGLKTTGTIPLNQVLSVVDRTHLKRRIPSTILLKKRFGKSNKIRFIPAQPRAQSIAELKARVNGMTLEQG